MLVPKADRKKFYDYLFQHGVLVAKKDFEAPKHSDELPIRNLYALKLAQSFESKGYLKCTFAWRHFYYFLTDQGVEFLREALGAPAEVVPATLVEKPLGRPTSVPDRSDRPDRPRGPRMPRREGEGPREGGREGYRRGGDRGERKEGDAPRRGFGGPRRGGDRPAAPAPSQ